MLVLPTAELQFRYRNVDSSGRHEHWPHRAHRHMLPDGTVMVCGGISTLRPSDLYDPYVSTFSTVGGLLQARQRHVSLLLMNPAWGSLVGKVLAIGGAFTGSPVFGGIQEALDTVELMIPQPGSSVFLGE